jgi:hypothetical protein
MALSTIRFPRVFFASVVMLAAMSTEQVRAQEERQQVFSHAGDAPGPPNDVRPEAGQNTESISFLSNTRNGATISRISPDGSGRQDFPVIGRSIASPARGRRFDSNWASIKHCNSQAFLLGLAYEEVVSVDGTSPRRSPLQESALRLVNVQQRTSMIVAPDCDTDSFCWGPDSRRFAYTQHSWRATLARGVANESARSRVLISSIDGSSDRALVLDKQGGWDVCDWSPDGHTLLLAHSRGPGNPIEDLYEVELDASSADGAGLHKVEAATLREGRTPRWLRDGRYSPNGEQILAIAEARKTQKADPNSVIPATAGADLDIVVVIDREGGDIATIAKPLPLSGPACWSPDGSRVAFGRVIADRPEIRSPVPGEISEVWIMNADGSEPRRIVAGWYPNWTVARPAAPKQ